MMDTTPIYELRERLRAAAMAGTNLLSEDFRLRRAYEAFQPLEKASPVFAKIGQLTGQLLSPECQNTQGALLDTITLADAVICTLGTVDVAGEIESAGVLNAGENAGSLIVNAPYSTLKELLEALTTSGGGHYGTVCDAHENHPELFKDYRVKYTLVQALGASYAELADQVERWMIEDNDMTILPALYKDFDPKGKKEMVRRVQVISELAGAGANDFYIKMLEEAQKDVRMELLDTLRHDPQNASLLRDLSKTEKGKNKDKVFELLAEMQDAETESFFAEFAKKKPGDALKYLRNSTTDWAAELAAAICEQMLDKAGSMDDNVSEEEIKDLSEKLLNAVRALFGKGGAHICECYRKLLARTDKINSLWQKTWKNTYENNESNTIQYGVLVPVPMQNWSRTRCIDIETTLGKILHQSLIANPDTALQELALKLYQGKGSRKSNVKFLAAAATVKFVRDEDCADWLEEQSRDKKLLAAKQSKERMKAITEAASFVTWNQRRNGYIFCGAYIEDYYTKYKKVEIPVRLKYAKKLVEWLKKHSSNEVDEILVRWTALNDEEMCRSMGEYFYKKALTTADNRKYLACMKACGWTACKGLAVHFFKSNPRQLGQWQLQDYLRNMPGDLNARMEEARTLSEMLKTGELNQGNIIVANLDKWIEEQR